MPIYQHVLAAVDLGENVVQGSVDRDEFCVHKHTYKQGKRVVLRRVLGDKQVKMVYAEARGSQTTRNISTPTRGSAPFLPLRR